MIIRFSVSGSEMPAMEILTVSWCLLMNDLMHLSTLHTCLTILRKISGEELKIILENNGKTGLCNWIFLNSL